MYRFMVRILRRRTVLLVIGLVCSILAFSSVLYPLFKVTSNTSLDHSHLMYNSSKDYVKSSYVSVSEADSLNDSPNQLIKGYQNYSEALQNRADQNGVIILISTDFGYIEMAMNLYYTSFKKLNIANFLYVCSDRKAAMALQKKGIAHFLIEEDRDGKAMSAYGSAAFKRKTHIKTRIIHNALTLGYTVLITDADIVFLKNPFPYFTCKDCDLEIQSDGQELNSGFYLVKPSKAGIKLHAKALSIAAKEPTLSNQKTLGRALAKTKVKTKTLDVSLFPHGKVYFEDGHRMFAGDNPCKECVIVHDNWLVSGAAKEYRLKEHLMWLVDSAQYYSNVNNKYITYENPFDFESKNTVSLELDALKSALSIAFLLKRILILPDFHCYGCKYGACRANRCSLNTHIRITTFNKAFGTSFREHMFLKNPLVPASIQSSVSPPILIHNAVTLAKVSEAQLNSIKHQFIPTDLAKGANSTEILKWFQGLDHYKIIHFHSIYNSFSKFESPHFDGAFTASLHTGFQRCSYRQY